MATYILGITAYRRDSAAALICDGEIVAAAREESFSRRCGDAAFPVAAIDYCLREAQLSPGAIDLVVFCDLLQSGGGLRSLVTALRRTQLQVMVRRELSALIGSGRHALPPLTLITHTQAAIERPASDDDADCALGAALHGWHQQLGNVRRVAAVSPWIGPWFGSDGICTWLDELGVTYRRVDDDVLVEAVAQQLIDGGAVGWLQGRLEFCARSLGGRSILCAPRLSDHLSSVRQLLVRNRALSAQLWALDPSSARDWLQQPARAELRAALPDDFAVLEVDAVAQPRLHRLLARVARDGCPLLIGIDFRCSDEPLVATPIDAYRCFMRRDLDSLVMEDVLLLRAQQPLWEESLTGGD